MKFDLKNITGEIEKEIEKLSFEDEVRNVGQVLEVGDGIVRVSGLSGVGMGEVLEFGHGTQGLVLNLEKESVGAIVLGDYLAIKEGDEVTANGQPLAIEVGEEILGRVVDALGRPIDGKGKIKTEQKMPVERLAPGVIERGLVDTPLYTGLKAIDSMIPIGRGQRELIIGDRETGKSAIALSAIISQKKTGVVCVYVAVGQKESKIARLAAKLEEEGAMNHTVIISAGASAPAAMQYLAPFAGTAIGEYFMRKGQDALIIYDDLSKHAWSYRQISLLLKRPSGREAYPGDIFYLHSRLLERAAKLSREQGGGSLTALPIIETQAGDVSAYIPTNVISITDGQIYLESDLFNAGVRPAVNVGLSVSRVGGAAQIKAMKQVAGRLRLEMASYRELAAFAQFGSDLDSATKAKLDRGARVAEVLKQGQYEPMAVEAQVLILWAATNGYLDDLPLERVSEFEKEFLEFMKDKHRTVIATIEKERELSEETKEKLKKAAEDFKKNF